MELYSTEWTSSVSSKAHNTLHNLKFNKQAYLPLAEDVLRLNSYLNRMVHVLYSKKVNVKNYRNFTEVALTQIVLFDRKRRGENMPKKSRLNLGSNSQPPGHESNMLTTEPPRRVKVKYCNFFISKADNSSSSGPIKSIIKLTQDLMVTYILTKFGADWLIFVHASA